MIFDASKWFTHMKCFRIVRNVTTWTDLLVSISVLLINTLFIMYYVGESRNNLSIFRLIHFSACHTIYSLGIERYFSPVPSMSTITLHWSIFLPACIEIYSRINCSFSVIKVSIITFHTASWQHADALSLPYWYSVSRISV